jgi:SAM-dependent methyltransferase
VRPARGGSGGLPPSDELLDRVERLLGSRADGWVRATGGYSIAERWSLDLADGRRVFTKLATTDDIARRLRTEHLNMTAIDADFRCEVLAWDDGDRPLLVVEDLRDAHWPPPWEPGEVDRVMETLERMWATTPPDHLPDAESYRDVLDGWAGFARDPSAFLALRLCSAEWLEEALPVLVEAERSHRLSGDELIHIDIRSDNLCVLPGRVVLVDWNFASRGRRELDLAYWLPSLRLEGGPLPEEVASGLGVEAAAVAGFFAKNAVLPPPEGAPTVRRFQLRQLRIALPWVCRELGLPQPDARWAEAEINAADADLAAGRITEAQWHAQIEEALIDAYLLSDDVRGQSGKGGDETDWRWSRELILDVFPQERASFLDVGCANGYLMESVHRWGRERGIEVEPYGLDISWRIAALARSRLPHWQDRIFVGNAMDWDPPRRFDVVQIGIDEVPQPRRRELVERVLREFVAPGGVLVCRAGRVGDSKYQTPDAQLHELGLHPDGVIERAHPKSGELRRTAWLRASV